MQFTQHGVLGRVKSQTLLVGIIGDSMADGVGATLGPDLPVGAMQAWDVRGAGASFADITTTDIANWDNTRGTPYKQFALDYYNRHNGMIRFVNCAKAGSFFYTASGTDSWAPSTAAVEGDLFAPAMTRLFNAKTAAGKEFDYLIVNLGINDAQGAVTIGTVTNTIGFFFAALRSQWPSIPILVVQVGCSNAGAKINNARQYSVRWKIRQQVAALTGVTVVWNNTSSYQDGTAGTALLLSTDEVHLTQKGNNLQGTSLANYHDAVIEGRSQRAAGELGCIVMDNAGDKIPVGYRNAFSTLIDALVTDSNYFQLESLYIANGVSKFQQCASGVSLFGMLWVGNPVWTQYRNWAFDGVDDWHGEVYIQSLDGNGATRTDHITFTRLAAIGQAASTNAALWGKQDVSGTRSIEMLRQNATGNVSYSVLDAAATASLGTVSVFSADVLYSTIRNGTTKGFYIGSTLNHSTTQADLGHSTTGVSRMCLNAAGSLVQFFDGDVQVVGFGKWTTMDITKLNTAIDNYVTAVKNL